MALDCNLVDSTRQIIIMAAVKNKPSLWLPLALLTVFALSRWPGLLPENFSAAYALAFCAGVYFRGSMAWWLPMGTLFLTNALLNVFYYHFPIFNLYTLVTLLAFAAVVGLGRLFPPRSSITRLVCGGLLGAILFYLVTNTISWVFEPTQPYPKTLAGWFKALTVGTSGWPETWKFFRNTLLSSGLFTALFAGSMKLAEKLEEEPAEVEDAPAKEQPDAQPEESNA